MNPLPTQNTYTFRFACPDKSNDRNSLSFQVAVEADTETEALESARQKFASVIVEINNRLDKIKPRVVGIKK